MFNPVNPKQSFPDLEHEIMEIWEKEGTFEKSVEKNKGKKKFVFFDGPPFANGLPHYGHILANSLKDAVTRYFNMKGYYVPRTNGWDCHGLPVEYEVEKDLELSGKKDIEMMGIEKFNGKCRESVFKYTDEWENLFKRIGRWVDFDNTYATLDNSYMESIWHVFKQIWDKKLVYQSFKSMHICPRCETPLSNFEVSQGYKDVTDYSVTAKFKIKGEEDTYVLAWTTTPWTLPGNSGLAMGPKIKYVKIAAEGGNYILAKDLVESVMGERDYKVLEEIKAKDLEGKEYAPLFDYFKNNKWGEGEKPYRIILADFVTTEDGTGVVHIAPAFGEDDLNAGKKHGLPVIGHVNFDGTFVDEVVELAGKFVKGQDQNVAKLLEEKGLLFEGKNFKHSYPHCWRCDTALLNFSTKSWFIEVTKIKEQLIKKNKKIHWQPDHIRDGRFGKWLENARDWAISRNRYWGCSMPIWECKCGEHKCIGSIDELIENTTNETTEITVVRHGQTDYNLERRWQGQQDIPLNDTGLKQAKDARDKLKDEQFDAVYSSDLVRAFETADIINKGKASEIIKEPALREKSNGTFENLTEPEIKDKYPEEWDKRLSNRHGYKYPDGESGEEVEERAVKAFEGIVRKHKGGKVMIVAHEGVLRVLKKYFDDLSVKGMYSYAPQNGEICKYTVIHKESHPDHFKGDIHKPYIDDVKIKCKCGDEMTRIPEVLDCWFESGSMPYAQLHYPFENKKEFEENFPANFIAEGLDQTRGWFYTLHVISNILFDSHCFDNVIVNGILLAADGEKLSKRKKNYPDPNELFDSKGVDSLRFFLYSSTAPLAQDVRFSEAHVDEIVKKLILTLWNSYSFFVTYANIDGWHPSQAGRVKVAKNKLDKWILSELNSLINTVTESMDEYNLTEATRPLMEFLDNVSNWYIRRSRRRFWKSENDDDKDRAYSTLYTVLTTYAKLLAPFTPFISDYIYRNLEGSSVHLCDWPKADKSQIDRSLNDEMAVLRRVVNLGHAVRAKARVKVRQPLAKVQVALPKNIKSGVLENEKDIILEELNVKELEVFKEVGDTVKTTVKPNAKVLGPKYGGEVQKIIGMARNGEFEIKGGDVVVGDYVLSGDEVEIGFEASQEGYDVGSIEGTVVILDTNITAELKEEGIARDLVRVIQEMRKEADYNVDDRITVWVDAPAELEAAIVSHADYIRRETLAIELQTSGNLESDIEKTATIEGLEVKVGIRK